MNILGKISNFFIERYRVVYLIIAAIVLLGFQSYISLPREEMPEIVFPVGMVTTSYIGAAPEEIENLITDEIEAKLKELDDVESITSTSSNGISSVMVEFEVGTDIDEKIDEIRNSVSEIQNNLPEDSSSPIIRGFETSDKPIITLNISGDYDLIRLKNIAEDIQDEIEKLNGISEVTLVGGLDREINIYVDTAKLATYDLSIDNIKSAIQYSNINAPGGDIELDDMQFNVRTVAEFEEIEEMEEIVVTVKDGLPIYLKDIAYIEDTSSDATSYSQIYDTSLSNGKSATMTITLSVMKDTDADIVGLSNEIKELIETGKGSLYPEDVFVAITGDEAVEVNEKLNDVVNNAISGLLIVIVVLFLFIGFRESIIVAFVIPLSLLSSFILMEYSGITLNTMSLVALILALGMLVDNAIVIMENIDRIRDEGLDVTSASKVATNQVAPAVFAATLTTISAFLPMAITSGMLGEFLKTIPITVMFAIGASFLISLVITPALCSRYLSKYKAKAKNTNSKLVFLRKILSIIFVFVLSLFAFMQDGKFGVLSWIGAIAFSGGMAIKEFKLSNSNHGDLKIIKHYINIMDKVLKSKVRRITVVIVAMAIFFASLLTIPLGILKIELFPTSDSTSITIDVETPSGYLLDDTSSVVSEVEEILFAYPEIESFVSKIGNTGNAIQSGGDNPNTAKISIDLVEMEERERSSIEIVASLRKEVKNIAGADITVGQSSMGPGSDKPISIELKGENLDLLEEVANDFKDILAGIPGTAEVSTSIGDGSKEIQVDIDKTQASLLGLSPLSIGQEIRNAIQGVEVSQFKENQDEIDIIIRTSDEEITIIDDFNKIYFTSNTGEKIAFSRVASLVETKGYNSIEHDDLKRIVKIESEMDGSSNSNMILNQFRTKISSYNLPKDIEVSYGGDAKQINESFTDMFINMILAILLVYIILSIQFNSLSQPLVILFSLPLAIIGAILGLIITNNNFGLLSFMGIVSLVGIAVNDAIVLVDYTNYLRKKDYGLLEAIKEAGKTRFLPVLATSITTIGGILPLALEDPDYAQMGFALIFGLVASTVLTLLIIPIIYSLSEEFKIWFKKRVPLLKDRRINEGVYRNEN